MPRPSLKKQVRLVGILMLAGMVSACPGTVSPIPGAVKESASQAEADPNPAQQTACHKVGLVGSGADEHWDLARILDAATDPGNANTILDCVVGPVSAQSPDEAFAKRQFRGHMVVTLLARYAMLNYTGRLGPEAQIRLTAYADGPDDAALTLAHIETAERYLREQIPEVNPNHKAVPRTTGGIIPFEESERLHRVIAVIQVAIDAHRPSIDRTRNVALNVLSAVAGSPGAVRATLKSIANGIQKGVVVYAFSKAYMRDAINYWKDLSDRPVDAADWGFWDRKLVEACDVLRDYAGQSAHHCLAGLTGANTQG